VTVVGVVIGRDERPRTGDEQRCAAGVAACDGRRRGHRSQRADSKRARAARHGGRGSSPLRV